MTRYLMSVCYPTDGVPPSPEELEQITADLTLVHQSSPPSRRISRRAIA